MQRSSIFSFRRKRNKQSKAQSGVGFNKLPKLAFNYTARMNARDKAKRNELTRWNGKCKQGEQSLSVVELLSVGKAPSTSVLPQISNSPNYQSINLQQLLETLPKKRGINLVCTTDFYYSTPFLFQQYIKQFNNTNGVQSYEISRL